MPFLALDTGIAMHYRDGGSGRPILFIPGFSATVDAWNYQVSDLHDRYRCICIDPRGHGLSDKPTSDYTYDEMCTDVRSLIQQLNLRDLTLVGWSMGAGVALKYILDHNSDGLVNKVVMIAPATPYFKQTETEPFGLDEQTAAITLESVRRAFPETMAAFADNNFHRTDLEATKQWFLRSWLEQPAYVASKYFRTLLNEDMRDRLGEVDVAVLICHGRHDKVADPRWAEFMLTRIPDCSFVWFENSGHSLMVEEPDKLSEEIGKFAG